MNDQHGQVLRPVLVVLLHERLAVEKHVGDPSVRSSGTTEGVGCVGLNSSISGLSRREQWSMEMETHLLDDGVSADGLRNGARQFVLMRMRNSELGTHLGVYSSRHREPRRDLSQQPADTNKESRSPNRLGLPEERSTRDNSLDLLESCAGRCPRTESEGESSAHRVSDEVQRDLGVKRGGVGDKVGDVTEREGPGGDAERLGSHCCLAKAGTEPRGSAGAREETLELGGRTRVGQRQRRRFPPLQTC